MNCNINLMIPNFSDNYVNVVTSQSIDETLVDKSDETKFATLSANSVGDEKNISETGTYFLMQYLKLFKINKTTKVLKLYVHFR